MNLKYVTPAEAARIRRVSRPRITAMVNAGIFKRVPIQGGYLLLRSEVENYQPTNKGGRPSKKKKAKV